jgi:hypothetical protein
VGAREVLLKKDYKMKMLEKIFWKKTLDTGIPGS